MREDDANPGLQFGAQLAVVVDLPVEYGPDATILVAQGLPAVFEVNDRQVAMAQAQGTMQMEGSAIRPRYASRWVKA